MKRCFGLPLISMRYSSSLTVAAFASVMLAVSLPVVHPLEPLGVDAGKRRKACEDHTISSHCASAHRPEPAFQNRRTESRGRRVHDVAAKHVLDLDFSTSARQRRWVARAVGRSSKTPRANLADGQRSQTACLQELRPQRLTSCHWLSSLRHSRAPRSLGLPSSHRGTIPE